MTNKTYICWTRTRLAWQLGSRVIIHLIMKFLKYRSLMYAQYLKKDLDVTEGTWTTKIIFFSSQNQEMSMMNNQSRLKNWCNLENRLVCRTLVVVLVFWSIVSCIFLSRTNIISWLAYRICNRETSLVKFRCYVFF